MAQLHDVVMTISIGIPIIDGPSQQTLPDQFTIRLIGPELIDDAAVIVDIAPSARGIDEEPAIPAQLAAIRVTGVNIVAASFTLDTALMYQFSFYIYRLDHGVVSLCQRLS
jgi:hypothetical protein